MRRELYERVAERYLERYKELCEFSEGKSNFRDVGGNLICILTAYAELGELGKDQRKYFMDALKAIRSYFRLLNKFPEFRDAELRLEDGYFPDLRKYVDSEEGKAEREKLFGYADCRAKHYIHLAEERLERNGR